MLSVFLHGVDWPCVPWAVVLCCAVLGASRSHWPHMSWRQTWGHWFRFLLIVWVGVDWVSGGESIRLFKFFFHCFLSLNFLVQCFGSWWGKYGSLDVCQSVVKAKEADLSKAHIIRGSNSFRIIRLYYLGSCMYTLCESDLLPFYRWAFASRAWLITK